MLGSAVDRCLIFEVVVGMISSTPKAPHHFYHCYLTYKSISSCAHSHNWGGLHFLLIDVKFKNVLISCSFTMIWAS